MPVHFSSSITSSADFTPQSMIVSKNDDDKISISEIFPPQPSPCHIKANQRDNREDPRRNMHAGPIRLV
jgi:hypothetical protein